MKNGRLKILLLVLAMIFSTFASGMTFVDYDGNDSFLPKVDTPVSKTFYFDEDGDIVTVSTDYWVKFTVSNDKMELSFETNNVEVDLISVKGGPEGYRVYSELGSSGSGLTPPTGFENDEVTIKYYQISHYSFVLGDIIPPPDPEGEIDITKIVVDEDEEVIEGDDNTFTFKIEVLVGEDDWEEIDESPVTINGNGTEPVSGLPMGTYRITEILIDEDYTLIGENGVIVELEKDGDEVKVEFKNEKESETPPNDTGSLTVHKRIERVNGSIDANLGDDEFTIKLSGPLPIDSDLYEERVLTINEDSSGDNVTFPNLPFGDYILVETHINGEPIGNTAYHIQLPGNNGEIVGSAVEIESKVTENRWLVNHETPPSWQGTIRIQKLIREEPNESLEGFEFELWKAGVKVRGPESTDIYGEIDFTGLPAGVYEIRELESEFIADYLDGNPLEIGPEIENENDDVWVVRVNNTRIEIDDIVVQKEVSNDDVLSGFIFRLYRIVEVGEGEFDEEFVAERTTGVSGMVVFEDQPDGDYVLYEVSKPGYEMGIGAPGSDNGEEFFHSENMTYPIVVTNRKLPAPELGEIEVEKTVLNRSGNPMSSTTPFYFILQMLIDDEWETIDDGSIIGNGTYVFDELEDGEYRVREVDIDNDFYLVGNNDIEVEVEDGSFENVEFTNRLKPLPPDDDDEDDDDDRPRPRPEPEEEDEDVLEIVVIEEPVPEAPPVIEVVEEVVPLATLPKTAAADQLIISGLGSALFAIGLLIKKRR